ncbi:MAG: branched-chain amino acid aminotransferase [Rickettsiales bacterium]|nr:branched-chain amino acid aminotransferase [Rickettsiales bacterium]|tara:strand:+ start:1246 stop:2121 length:876 start_codon:yes stop_codon:yes gene_type:complete
MQLIPFDKREGFIWMNGNLLEWNQAKIHVLNHGLHYGSCVFEGIRVYNKKIFKLKEHIERLFFSAKILDLDIPYKLEELIKFTELIVKKQNIEDGYIRPVVWRGSEMMAISSKEASINIAIAAWKWPSYFSPEKILQGINMTIAEWKRPPPNCAPTNSKAAGLYMICSLSKHKAESNGFDDALMLDYRNFIAEATGANIFFIKNKKIFTPIADCFLNGITRKTVIEIANNIGMDVEEKHLEVNFMRDCNEAFLTGTAVEITPINRIDDYKFNDRDVTKLLIKEFTDYVIRN